VNRIETFEASLHGSQRQQTLLLRRYGIEPTEVNLAVLVRYAARVKRARWYGVIGVVVAASLGWFEVTDGLQPAVLLAGYLVGSGVAELRSVRPPPSGTLHVASLSHRRPALLLPTWIRLLPWVSLVPLLAAPLLLVGDHPVGVFAFRDRSGSVHMTATWFSGEVVTTTVALALACLALWHATLHLLTTRPLPLEDSDLARVDVLTRALSARAVSGTAAALGLALLARLFVLGGRALDSQVCTSVQDCRPVYGWHEHAAALDWTGGCLLLASLLVFWASRLPRVDRRAWSGTLATTP
jgi:hypothetical protein